MTDEVSVVRSFSAKWIESPGVDLHLKVVIEGEEFLMTPEDADELSDFIMKTPNEVFRLGMLG
jgi:hypothetical protein